MSQQPYNQDNMNQQAQPGNGANMGQASSFNQHGSRSASPNNAMGMGMNLQAQNPALAGATPEQLQAMAANMQQQQLAMNPYALQQMQQLQALQQLQQQQNLQNSLQGLPSGLQMPTTDPSSGQNQSSQPQQQQQLSAQNQQQQQLQLLQQNQLLQAALMQQQYNNPLLAMTAPQGQFLNQGLNFNQGSLNAQQMQQLYGSQLGQSAPALNINGIAQPPFGKMPQEQQNILNINITPQQQLRSPKDQQNPAYMLRQEPMSKDDPAANMNRDLSAPRTQAAMRQQSPLKQDVNRNARSRPRQGDPSKKSPRNDKSKSRGRSRQGQTFVAGALAKETADSQRIHGGKLSVRKQIKQQIKHLQVLEDTLKEKKMHSQSRSPARQDGVNFDPQNAAALAQANQQAQFEQYQKQQQQLLQYNQALLANQMGTQQPYHAFPSLANQVLGMQNQQVPVDANQIDQPRRNTFAYDQNQMAQTQPSATQIQETPTLVREEPTTQQQPNEMGKSMKSRKSKKSPVNQMRQISGESWNQRQISGPMPNVNTAEMFDKVPSQPNTGRKASNEKEPTPRSSRQSEQKTKISAKQQRKHSNELSKPVQREPRHIEPGPFEGISKKEPTPPRMSEPRDNTPPKYQKNQKTTSQSDIRSKGTSSNLNVIQNNVPSQELPIDLDAMEKFMKEEESLEKAIEREKRKNQEEVDAIINEEAVLQDTFKNSQNKMQMAQKLAAEDQQLADTIKDAEALFDQPSMKELPSESMGQLEKDVDAIAPYPANVEMPIQPDDAPIASLQQLENEINQVVEPSPRQKDQSQRSVHGMNLDEIANEINQPITNKSAMLPENGMSQIDAANPMAPRDSIPDPVRGISIKDNFDSGHAAVPTQDDVPPGMEPEVIVDLADSKCLPFFETQIKTKQEIIALEVDSEKEDTDGYLSEEIDRKKSQIGIFNSSQKELKKELELSDKAKKSNTGVGSDKNDKIRKMKEKEKEKQKKGGDDGSDKSEKEKKAPEPVIREKYETMSHEQIKQQMYLSQRGLLYQVRGLQQKKGHKFLIKNDSENNLYEYLQEFRDPVRIDKNGIFEINHPKKIYFEVFVILLAIYNCFGIPLEICFQPVTMEATEFVILNSIIDFIFGIDIYVQFKTTFYDPLSGDEVFDKRIIFWTYLKGRFIVDFMATVPFDNITYAITQKRIAILPLFSLLKLIRITRLGRIIERMNVREHIKLMMKLSQIIFMLIMFIHCQACAWFYIVSLTKDWTAPLDGIDPNNDLYNDSTVRKYLISVYYSILLLTCNDITPKGQWKIFFCAASVTLGAIINSIIFGNMALIIQNLNQKNSEFQESIDLANTAMKNMDMPKELQQDVVSYLQYTQQSQNGQQEFEYFYQCLSPSLRNEVIQLIFKEVTMNCKLFDENENLIEFFIKSLSLMLLDPEFPLVNQGEKDSRFFFIKHGECEVFVKDPIHKRDTHVRVLRQGSFFGEVSLLTKQPRTASVRPKIYAMIGYFHEQKFEEMVFMFPEVRSSLQKHFFTYDDVNRQWQREQLKNIRFMYMLQVEILDELTIILNNEIFDENQEIFKQGQVPDKVYVLARGKIEIFLTIPEGELILDTITEPGSVFAQISILNRMKMTYSARAGEDSEILTISHEKLNEQRALNHMQPLNAEIDKYHDKVINPLNLNDKLNLIGFLDYNKKRPKNMKKMSQAQRAEIWKQVINRQVMICRFQLKKDNILTDLIAELKKMSMDDQQKSMNKMKELVKSIAPIIVSKLKKLVSNRIKQVHQESLKQNQSIKNIHSIIQLINDQHKQKQQSLPPSEKKSKSKKASADDDKKSEKSPAKYKGAGLQNIEEQDDENKTSEESINLTDEEQEY